MDFKIIDAHMHFSDVQAFYTAAEEAGITYTRESYLAECEAAGIEKAVCMGLVEATPHMFPDALSPTPMTANLCEDVPSSIFTCLGINPHNLDADAIKRIRERVKNDPTVVGFKIYAGYYHYYVHDPIYAPVYQIAAEFGKTVAIHTGVTYSEQGIMDYSHPLTADRMAVQYRDTQFLLCHMGNPWIMDACEVAYKNRNVFLDISGLVEGSPQHIDFTMSQPLLMQHYTTGLVYLNDYKKVLFGTDWPIVPLGKYIEFCKKIIPEMHYRDVFRDNATRVYKLS
ncbi:MAG: amidohydrolase [Defluviitaleaceae bacterium]|nr:amidohydrolase [Defluviitaleaceae bacterium]MCL2189764.1 amidohydrolase [Defluviitaleaceae bacterium]MCL2275396.1 amidohydrolase [Defluviitaleaceae bacterium]